MTDAATAVDPRDRSRLRALGWPAAVGGFAFLFVFWDAWVPSLWGDEAASIMSAERPWPSLWLMVHDIDAVHGTYYAFLHLWIDLFGASTVAVRLPSSLAIGLAAAGLVVLVRRLSTLPVALVAGVVLPLLPRSDYAGIEAREYAMTEAAAVWLTVLLVELVLRGNRSWLLWLCYSLALATSVYLYLYLAFMAAAHLLVLLTSAAGRRALPRFLPAVALAMVLDIPIGRLAIDERDQLAFLRHQDFITPESFLVGQWFGSKKLALLAWLLIAAVLVIGIVLLLRRGRAIRWLRPQPGAFDAQRGLALVAVAGFWFAVLPLALLFASRRDPVYTIRYTTSVTPAAAILIAVALTTLTRRAWQLAAATALVAALALITDVQQRGPYAMNGSDWAEVAQVIAAHKRPGDAVVFSDERHESRRPRLIEHVYPEAFRGVHDLLLATPYTEMPGLWDGTVSIGDGRRLLDAWHGRLWFIRYIGLGAEPVVEHRELRDIARDGFVLHRSWREHEDVVSLFTKGDRS